MSVDNYAPCEYQALIESHIVEIAHFWMILLSNAGLIGLKSV